MALIFAILDSSKFDELNEQLKMTQRRYEDLQAEIQKLVGKVSEATIAIYNAEERVNRLGVPGLAPDDKDALEASTTAVINITERLNLLAAQPPTPIPTPTPTPPPTPPPTA